MAFDVLQAMLDYHYWARDRLLDAARAADAGAAQSRPGQQLQVDPRHDRALYVADGPGIRAGRAIRRGAAAARPCSAIASVRRAWSR